MKFRDMLYGEIELPEWISPFLRIPEFARLRGVRLSNVDSIDFKDFGVATRWEHGVAVAYLAWLTGARRGLPLKQRVELTLAGLLHDVATPPFAHTVEYVLEGFDHEVETERVLLQGISEDVDPQWPIFCSLLPRFRIECKNISRALGVDIDPDAVAEAVVGKGELGFLISGTLDLDNADNVVRGCHLMGLNVDRQLPVRIAHWLALQDVVPLSLGDTTEIDVQAWRNLRKAYYKNFFCASDLEQGRQALLQHLIRRGIDAGIPRKAIIWNTDEGLLAALATIPRASTSSDPPLRELVDRYRTLDVTRKICDLELFDESALRLLLAPHFASWLERELRNDRFEPFVMVSRNRSGRGPADGTLFNLPIGRLQIFKLGSPLIWEHLPPWIRTLAANRAGGRGLIMTLEEIFNSQIHEWERHRPWNRGRGNVARKVDVGTNLSAAGDWGFRLSRNESIHPYPGTFVHAIPAMLISCLGLKGETVLDPFGGSGQTALEVIKSGGIGISADSNLVATLIARARSTFLSADERQNLLAIDREDFADLDDGGAPEFALRDKWHHPKTLAELCRIRTYVSQVRKESLRTFLTACFSAILPNATARKGKQHGFFADNTPLAADCSQPPYIDAFQLFRNRVRTSVRIQERLYGDIERRGADPEAELQRMKVLRRSVVGSSPDAFGIAPGSLQGIITSPPYLCMADYALGNRLSYYWLAPDELLADYSQEIGARRQRSKPDLAQAQYFKQMTSFAELSASSLQTGGFLATVLGAPVAKAFESVDIFSRIDNTFNDFGLKKIWSGWRSIHWHRNQGYQRLREELISVYQRA